MDSPNPSSSGQAYLDERITVEMSRGEAMTVIAALHLYIRERGTFRIQFADDETSVTPSTDDPEAPNQELLTYLGRLIWRLEDAAASPRTVGRHSEDAVDPGNA